MRLVTLFVASLLIGCSTPVVPPDAAPDLERPHAPMLAEGIPPTVYYDGAGGRIGPSFNVQFQSGVTGGISGGRLTLLAASLEAPKLCAADGTSCTDVGTLSGTDGGFLSFGLATLRRSGNTAGIQIYGTDDFPNFKILSTSAAGSTYLGWGASGGASLDASIYRSGANTLTVGTGDNSGTGNLTAATITATTYVGLPAHEFHVSAYDAADNSTGTKIQQWIITNASTLQSGNFTGSVVGVGGANYVVKLCSDVATCSGANLKATLTVSCTATAGTTTAITINNSAISAGATLTLQPSTACGTTAETGNFDFNFSQP